MIAINPKLEFKLRTLQNWAFCMGGFALWALLFAPFPFRWLMYAVGIAIAVYILFFVLDKRASLIDCPHCGKKVATNTPWVCGVGACGRNNLNVDDFPFTHRCEHCGVEPTAYQCHHADCGKLIFFSEDQQAQNYARCLSSGPPAPPPQNKDVLRQEEKEDLLHEIDMTKSKAELEELRENLKSRKRTKTEQIEEGFLNYRGTVMGARAFAREWKQRKTAELKDDPDLLQDELDTLKAWLQDRGFDGME